MLLEIEGHRDLHVAAVGDRRGHFQGLHPYESGWNVLPPYQGRGKAAAAGTALLAVVRAAAHQPDMPHHLHAFPSVENVPSNALCNRLGFTLLGACTFVYPPGSGTLMRSNDWRLDLTHATPANHGNGNRTVHR